MKNLLSLVCLMALACGGRVGVALIETEDSGPPPAVDAGVQDAGVDPGVDAGRDAGCEGDDDDDGGGRHRG